MNEHDIAEVAFNNGYEKGCADGKPKWIPVTERLPDKSVTFVVVADSKYGMPMRVVRRDSIMSHEFMGKHYGYFSQGVQITHWMTLPEPPKGE